MRTKFILSTVLGVVLAASAADDTNSASGNPGGYVLLPSPRASHLLLQRKDRLAICGDSITEQKMYSRIIEDYLTMCVPDLKVTVRQYGWSGEHAPEFLARMTNDCLRFKPTVATTCYGMNDHQYRTYTESIGETYRTNQDAIIRAFKAKDVRVILGSAGCVGKVPRWQTNGGYTVDELNQNLGKLRNIDVALAHSEKVAFADVFWPMLNASSVAHEKYGTNYNVSGTDGVHPNWAGHTIMAYAFLKAMGLNGDLGTFTVDLGKNRMKTSDGHQVISSKDGEFQIRSSRFPFCPCEPEAAAAGHYPHCENDDITKDNSIQSGMTLVPFNQDLNRLMLVVKNGKAQQYRVTWGATSKTFSAADLEHGINLAAEFPANPFGESFAKVDSAVAAKQAFETKEMKTDFRSPVRRPTPEQLADQTAKVLGDDEKKHQELADAVSSAFVPVTHVIKISPE
jgi:lysophospholipase L1-like esterase